MIDDRSIDIFVDMPINDRYMYNAVMSLMLLKQNIDRDYRGGSMAVGVSFGVMDKLNSMKNAQISSRQPLSRFELL